jgi:adenosylcobyric acid synthase
MLENTAFVQALFGAQAPSLEVVFARLAEGVQAWFAQEA